ncbi:MAG TPA: RNA polymerase sigma factor [Candidatus Polarisedimenticolaceae bacterium]|nr:RNA polymerase sigma factor [Candidatus Polarisedimenticolaceae bacterium]
MTIAIDALPDEEVVSRVLAGETALYEVVMRRHNRRLYRVVRGIIGNDRDVEDVMQDAYVEAFQHLARFEGRSRLSTWLTRIAINEALSRQKQAQRIEEWDAMSETHRDALAGDERRDPETEASSTELGRMLEDSIERLPASYRAVVILRDVEELSTAEVAECLSISEDNVRMRLHRAHILLRKELDAGAKDAFPFPATRCDRIVLGVFNRVEHA